MWIKFPVYWKQYDDKDWASNHRPSDVKSTVHANHYTTAPPLLSASYVIYFPWELTKVLIHFFSVSLSHERKR